MKRKPIWQASIGIGLLLLGALLAYFPSRGFTQRHVIAAASACRVDMLIVAKAGAAPAERPGAVVLFHGLSANKYIMTYLARSFALLGLTVYVPDLPGHGRTPGPFSPLAAQDCAASLLRGLEARGLLEPDRTILAGHSMGAAIALRVAPQFRPAGVIALSPAPMQAAHGVRFDEMLFQGVPPLGPNTLITAGRFEPQGLAANAADLVPKNNGDPTIEFRLLPWQTHVSELFSSRVAWMTQEWAGRVLRMPDPARLPSRVFLLGGLLGFIGILVLAGPFLRELTTEVPAGEARDDAAPTTPRSLAEFLLVSAIAVALLRYLHPLKVLGLFEGDYLAGFFLLSGLGVILLHPRLAQRKFAVVPSAVLLAGFAALILHLLVTGWFDLTITGAWLNLQRWMRFPLFFFAAFFFLYGLEILLGPVLEAERQQRLGIDLLAITLAWACLAVGTTLLHSGEILLVLLVPYFAVFFVLSRMGARLVRERTASATAAAVFGAILLAGFCLVLFPVS
ncbi:MAG TPA: alpha/beta fold hydrolase [Candidatus Eisenbacteria bacterium]|nr:alpha/beta fold hydrolase [Candidatus Eisenbacteria bacterium]